MLKPGCNLIISGPDLGLVFSSPTGISVVLCKYLLSVKLAHIKCIICSSYSILQSAREILPFQRYPGNFYLSDSNFINNNSRSSSDNEGNFNVLEVESHYIDHIFARKFSRNQRCPIILSLGSYHQKHASQLLMNRKSEKDAYKDVRSERQSYTTFDLTEKN